MSVGSKHWFSQFEQKYFSVLSPTEPSLHTHSHILTLGHTHATLYTRTHIPYYVLTSNFSMYLFGIPSVIQTHYILNHITSFPI